MWIRMIPPKWAHEKMGLYSGSWSTQLDRCWESDDGYSVSSRLIRTDWGNVEHVTIQRLCGGGDIPWSEKQRIKNELFGEKRAAIEVFPAEKNLVDVCDIYHLWVLPKDFVIPFGLHPKRDPQGKPVQRGYGADFNAEEMQKWIESPERIGFMRERYSDNGDT